MKEDNALIIKEEFMDDHSLTNKSVSNSLINIKDEVQTMPIGIFLNQIVREKPKNFFIYKNKSRIEKVILKTRNAVKKLEIKNFMDIQNFEQNEILNSKKIQREFVAISSKDEINFIKMDDILYCQADGKCTKFFLENGCTLLSDKNIGEYENNILDKKNFFRVHNSYIINILFVSKIDKRDGMSCELLNGISLPVSTRRIEKFSRFIRIKE